MTSGVGDAGPGTEQAPGKCLLPAPTMESAKPLMLTAESHLNQGQRTAFLVLGQKEQCVVQTGVGQNSGGDACLCTWWHQCGQGSRQRERPRALWFPAQEDENQEQDDFPNWCEWMQGHTSSLTPVNLLPGHCSQQVFQSQDESLHVHVFWPEMP